MSNNQFSNRQTQSKNAVVERQAIGEKINIEQLDLPIQEQLNELSNEESNNVVAGFYVTYWNPYPNPLTPAILSQTRAAQTQFQIQNDNFLAWLSS